jgi:hypothetical protein
MRAVRSRLDRVQRQLRPTGLAAEWEQVLMASNKRWGLETDRETIRGLARDAAATGRRPGDVLAELLVAQAENRM